MTQVEHGSGFVTRAYTYPRAGERLDELAARLLPDHDDPRATLLSWNPHLAVRLPLIEALGGMLPTDIVYVEPAGTP
jgi:hypothetical protein